MRWPGRRSSIACYRLSGAGPRSVARRHLVAEEHLAPLARRLEQPQADLHGGPAPAAVVRRRPVVHHGLVELLDYHLVARPVVGHGDLLLASSPYRYRPSGDCRKSARWQLTRTRPKKYWWRDAAGAGAGTGALGGEGTPPP